MTPSIPEDMCCVVLRPSDGGFIKVRKQYPTLSLRIRVLRRLSSIKHRGSTKRKERDRRVQDGRVPDQLV